MPQKTPGSAFLLMVLHLKGVANPDFWVILCDTLSWNDHVSDLCDGIRSNVALLQPCRFCISRRAAIILYHHFLSFHFIYGVHIYYGMAPLYITNPLCLLQKTGILINCKFSICSKTSCVQSESGKIAEPPSFTTPC